MPYIDFGGSSKQTPVKEHNNNFNCTNCIHKCKSSDDLFICTINGTFEFNNIKRKENCIYKNIIPNDRLCCFGIFYIDSDGNKKWTGSMSIFKILNGQMDDNIINVFFNKAFPDFIEHNPSTKDLIVIPILIAEKVNNNYFKPIGNLLPSNVISKIIYDLNNNIDKFKNNND